MSWYAHDAYIEIAKVAAPETAEERDRLKEEKAELVDILDRLVMYYNPGEDRPEALFKLNHAMELLAKATEATK